VDGFAADLIITTIQPTWRRAVAAAASAGALGRLVYWHHAGGVPAGHGCVLAAPPSIDPQRGLGAPRGAAAVELGG
jgi:hypothetical protein